MSKDELEQANWQIAHSWAAGLELFYDDIDLGDLSIYSVLSVLGRVQLQAMELEQMATNKLELLS